MRSSEEEKGRGRGKEEEGGKDTEGRDGLSELRRLKVFNDKVRIGNYISQVTAILIFMHMDIPICINR